MPLKSFLGGGYENISRCLKANVSDAGIAYAEEYEEAIST